MTGRIPEPADPFEEEGIPTQGDGLPQKRIAGDWQDGLEPPHDFFMAADDYGTTAREQSEGEALSMRVDREVPDVLEAVDQPASAAADSDSPFPEGDDRVGRIVETDEGARTDAEKDAVAYDAGTDLGGLTAEEAAMHIEPQG